MCQPSPASPRTRLCHKCLMHQVWPCTCHPVSLCPGTSTRAWPVPAHHRWSGVISQGPWPLTNIMFPPILTQIQGVRAIDIFTPQSFPFYIYSTVTAAHFDANLGTGPDIPDGPPDHVLTTSRSSPRSQGLTLRISRSQMPQRK